MSHTPVTPNQNKPLLKMPNNIALLNESNKIFQHGVHFFNQGKIELAKDLFEQVLKINTKHFDAMHLLGISSAQLKDFKPAIQFFRKAIKLNPLHIHCYCNLGNAYLETQELELALINYNKAIEIKSDFADAHCYKGLALTGLKRFDEAIKSLNIAINLKTDFAEAYANLGNAYKENKQFEMALANYDKAITIKSNYAMAFSNRGNILKELDRPNEAIKSFKKAIEIQPNYAEAYFNLGNTFNNINKYEEALTNFKKAIEIQPNYAEAYFNLGNTFKNIKKYEEALINFNQAIQIKSDYAEAYWNKATVLLEKGSFQDAWLIYDWRWQNKELGLKKISTNKPQAIDSNSLINKKILVWGEQGVGDQVLYAGMLDQLLLKASVVNLKLDPRISPMLHRVMPTAIFHDDKKNIKEIDFDMHIPVADLGKLFLTDSSSFMPNRKYYMQADPIHSTEVRESLLKNKKFLCGVTWHSKRESFGNEKSVTLKNLLPILAIKDIAFVSLQYGDVKQQISEFNSLNNLNIQECDAIDNFHDLDGHAALIEACDFVVSISNTSAHISGALGKETYLLCPVGKGALWYWYNELDGNSMWYPSVKIIRQETPGYWDDVIEKIRKLIQKKLDT